MSYTSGSHTVFHHRYHIVWITKYRYKVLEGALRERIRTIIRQVCRELGVQIVSGVLSREHVHMFVEIPPHIAVITNTSTVQTGWPGASMWFGDLPASNNDWVQSNGTGGPLPGYPGQFTQIVWAYVFVTGPNAWQAQPNQSTAAFIIDNNPNIQNAVNGVYGPNNGAPSYFKSLFALTFSPVAASYRLLYDRLWVSPETRSAARRYYQAEWIVRLRRYLFRDPTGTGEAILTRRGGRKWECARVEYPELSQFTQSKPSRGR